LEVIEGRLSVNQVENSEESGLVETLFSLKNKHIIGLASWLETRATADIRRHLPTRERYAGLVPNSSFALA
jgi:hypothetical protein